MDVNLTPRLLTEAIRMALRPFPVFGLVTVDIEVREVMAVHFAGPRAGEPSMLGPPRPWEHVVAATEPSTLLRAHLSFMERLGCALH